jgi:hypothetical protein
MTSTRALKRLYEHDMSKTPCTLNFKNFSGKLSADERDDIQSKLNTALNKLSSVNDDSSLSITDTS